MWHLTVIGNHGLIAERHAFAVRASGEWRLAHEAEGIAAKRLWPASLERDFIYGAEEEGVESVYIGC